VKAVESSIVGVSSSIRDLRDEIARIARSDAKVLISGESGVGKELVAHDLHVFGPRGPRPFVPVNCAGLPEELLESELFGHLRGSFTGAYRDKPGQLEIAHTGTVLLDEIGEMTPRMQGLLLRFLETGELQKVGAERPNVKVDVRVLAATHRDLKEMVRQGQFREDLFYRLNVITLHVPPLRDRREDIPILADLFLQRFTRRHESVVRALGDDVLATLVAYSWPGNVRELENVIERLVVVGRKPVVELENVPLEIRLGRAQEGRPGQERRRTVVDDLFERLISRRESFWTVVYPLYIEREITRGTVRELVRRGLIEARGNYKGVARLFNLGPHDYKRFLGFLRKHQCQVPFRDFRC